MLGKRYDAQICSIARALELVGERWSLLIVRDALFAGVTRFNDFQHNLGVATNVLAARLEGFVESGIMERRSTAHADQHQYVLTAMGRDLTCTLVALTEWGDRWATAGEPPIVYRHTGCNDVVSPAVTCARCGPIDAGEVEVALGPGMPAEFAATRRSRKDG